MDFQQISLPNFVFVMSVKSATGTKRSVCQENALREQKPVGVFHKTVAEIIILFQLKTISCF